MITLLIILGYIMGSIPSGYILAKKYYSIDIRKFGSGNIGATNVKRVCGKKLGLATTIFDMTKALIPLVFTDLLIYFNIIEISRPLALTAVALSVILGHNYTIFLNFKGGKGVATTVAAFTYILPFPTFISILVFLGLKFITRIVSIRSMALGTTLFISTFILGYDKIYIYATFISCLLIFLRHKSNIQRIITGEEQ